LENEFFLTRIPGGLKAPLYIVLFLFSKDKENIFSSFMMIFLLEKSESQGSELSTLGSRKIFGISQT